MIRQTRSGPFRTQYWGHGIWSLASVAPITCHVYLRVTGSVDDALQDGGIGSLQLEWHAEGVTVRVTRSGGSRVLEARSALIHESLPGLYDALPLAGFDSKARRFWRRVFLLMRVPGGRRLLHLIVGARPTRKG